jgi:hypothetical protein
MQKTESKENKGAKYRTLKVREDLYMRVLSIQHAYFKVFAQKIAVTDLLEKALASLATEAEARKYMAEAESARRDKEKGRVR